MVRVDHDRGETAKIAEPTAKSGSGSIGPMDVRFWVYWRRTALGRTRQLTGIGSTTAIAAKRTVGVIGHTAEKGRLPRFRSIEKNSTVPVA